MEEEQITLSMALTNDNDYLMVYDGNDEDNDDFGLSSGLHVRASYQTDSARYDFSVDCRLYTEKIDGTGVETSDGSGYRMDSNVHVLAPDQRVAEEFTIDLKRINSYGQILGIKQSNIRREGGIGADIQEWWHADVLDGFNPYDNKENEDVTQSKTTTVYVGKEKITEYGNLSMRQTIEVGIGYESISDTWSAEGSYSVEASYQVFDNYDKINIVASAELEGSTNNYLKTIAGGGIDIYGVTIGAEQVNDSRVKAVKDHNEIVSKMDFKMSF